MVNANPFHHGSPQAGTRNTRDRSKDQSLSVSIVVAQILTIITTLSTHPERHSISVPTKHVSYRPGCLLLRISFPSFRQI